MTQPDRPVGRGLKAHPSAVKRYAMEHGIELFQPHSLKDPDAVDRVGRVRAEAMVVAAYGLILPAEVLQATSVGAINIHASLLPRWRGAAPIQRALLAGDRETGISIMQMDAGLDTGPLLSQQAIPIGPDDDAGTLHEKLAGMGARMLLQALEAVSSGTAKPAPQSKAGATYAAKVNKLEASIDWSRSALEIERQVRALRPTPGAFTALEGVPLKIWRAKVCDETTGAPGTVLESRVAELLIGCGKGMLSVQEVQRSGARRLAVADFLLGHPLPPGTRLG
jgi:methionyl-tRNA formyltransferase